MLSDVSDEQKKQLEKGGGSPGEKRAGPELLYGVQVKGKTLYA